MKWIGAALLVIGLSGVFAARPAEAPAVTLTGTTPLVQQLEVNSLRAAHQDATAVASSRRPIENVWALEDVRAVIHERPAGSASIASLNETRSRLAAEAKQSGVRALFVAESNPALVPQWNGPSEDVLFIAGVRETNGLLRFPQFDEPGRVRTNGELRFVDLRSSNLSVAGSSPNNGVILGYIGLAGAAGSSIKGVLESAHRDPASWRDITNRWAMWPDEFLSTSSTLQLSPEIVRAWSEERQRGRRTAVVVDAESDRDTIGGIDFAPAHLRFRQATTHLLVSAFKESELRDALTRGRAYVAADWMADPSGFVFAAVNNLGVFPMGDTALVQGSTRLTSLTPVPARQRLIFDGAVIAETNGTNLTFATKNPGVYRLEAALQVVGEWRTWIISNPVYLREASLFDIPLPNTVASPQVVVRKGLTYVDGKPEDEAKHQLDVYSPAAAQSHHPATVFVFIHGGAWRSGDRNLYGPLGQRFARDGIVTVIPSYRLAPKRPWPAQAEDAAAAVAWAFAHVHEFGGDTNRLFVGGHSAGGHLSALLMFNRKYLEAVTVSPDRIRGVVCLSGVYDVEFGEVLNTVFGRDRAVRREASPIRFVHAPAPPFFVSYCEWDYPTLGAQAKMFDATLRRTGISSQLFFTPRDNHIYEMISMTRDDDATGQAVVKFLREH